MSGRQSEVELLRVLTLTDDDVMTMAISYSPPFPIPSPNPAVNISPQDPARCYPGTQQDPCFFLKCHLILPRHMTKSQGRGTSVPVLISVNFRGEKKNLISGFLCTGAAESVVDSSFLKPIIWMQLAGSLKMTFKFWPSCFHITSARVTHMY